MLIDIIAGARPNFMKIAPIIACIQAAGKSGKNINYRLIHTGQHYDKNMSADFFQQLNIPEPDINLGAGSGTHAEQAAAIMIGYEKVLLNKKSDLCMVVGDVTSTMACAISAQKLHVRVAHVEGGIRSGDWTMPEEINRMVTDSITNYFFTTSATANEILRNSGVSDDRIFFVGNTMIDSLLGNRERFLKPEFWDELGLKEKNYMVITLHRPANVDEENNLQRLLEKIIETSRDLLLIFPAHPRTFRMISQLGMTHPRLHITEPMGYLEFNYLVERSKAVITDSGGITEETTVMGIPCMTLRDNTERPETITIGTNELIGTDPDAISPYMKKLFAGTWKKGRIPDLWDGKSAQRIVEALLQLKSVND